MRMISLFSFFNPINYFITINSKRITPSVLVRTQLILLFTLGACFRESATVQPGSQDYPITNLHPTHLVNLQVEYPSTLRVNFSAGYTATISNSTCKRAVGLGAFTSLNLPLPIVMTPTQKNNTYKATLIIDRFRPGQCGWTLAVAEATVEKHGATLFRGGFWTPEPVLASTNQNMTDANQKGPTQRITWRCKKYNFEPVSGTAKIGTLVCDDRPIPRDVDTVNRVPGDIVFEIYDNE